MSNPEMIDDQAEQLEATEEVKAEQEAAETTEDADSDFTFVIDGVEQETQQSEPTAAEKMQNAIIREKKRYKQERDEKRELEQKLEALEKQMAAMQAPSTPQVTPKPKAPVKMPEPPNKMDYVSDAEYERAKESYANSFQAWFQSMNETKQQESSRQAQIEARRSKVQQSVASHFARAAKFAEENKIPVDKYQAAEITVRDALGSEIVDDLIDVVGDGAEKGMMYLGSNQQALQNISALIRSGDSLKAVAEFTKLANKAKIQRGKKISSAPPPDEALHGDASTSVSIENARKHFQSLIEKDKGDIRRARQYRKDMRAKGIEF